MDFESINSKMDFESIKNGKMDFESKDCQMDFDLSSNMKEILQNVSHVSSILE